MQPGIMQHSTAQYSTAQQLYCNVMYLSVRKRGIACCPASFYDPSAPLSGWHLPSYLLLVLSSPASPASPFARGQNHPLNKPRKRHTPHLFASHLSISCSFHSCHSPTIPSTPRFVSAARPWTTKSSPLRPSTPLCLAMPTSTELLAFA